MMAKWLSDVFTHPDPHGLLRVYGESVLPSLRDS